MKIIHTIKELEEFLNPFWLSKKSVGLVPTMGALHRGHLSLVERCRKENTCAVVSVFVNPTQFNDQTDLANYPRTLEADCELLEKYRVDAVFTPTVEEIYPEPDTRTFSYPPLDQVMEGKFRPGHFNGVCQVVSKLFMLVKPTKAYFGEKDYQQLAIVRAMVDDLELGVDVVGCPIVREKDGLALSSRNKLLSPDQREVALHISHVLKKSREVKKEQTVEETKNYVVKAIEQEPNLKLEYFEIVDGKNLQPISSWEQTLQPVGCITVYCGKVRLIDNIQY